DVSFMIGVITTRARENAVREFFELFKTPWEFYHDGRPYQVLLSDRSDCGENPASITIIFAGSLPCDSATPDLHAWAPRAEGRFLVHGSARIPIYGNTTTFPGKQTECLTDAESQEPAAYVEQSNGRTTIRLGYDLFREVEFLLTSGQPQSNSMIPTLELHIALLRDLIVEAGAQIIEIPPVPEGHKFFACLTHDVDHPSVRQHKIDHTTFGFLYPA